MSGLCSPVRIVFAKIRKIFFLLTPRMRLCWAGLIPFSFAEACLESIGAAAIFALIKIMDSQQSISGIPIVSRLCAIFNMHDRTTVVLTFTVMAAVFFVLKNIFQLAFACLRSAMTGRTVAALSGELFSRYLHAPFSFHFRRNSAVLIDRVLRSTDEAVRKVLESAVACVSEILVLCGMIAVLIAAAPMMALVSLAVICLVLGGLLYVTARLFYRLGEQQNTLSVRSQSTLQQALGGIKEVKVMDRERYWHDMFFSNQRGITKIRTWHATLNSAPRLLVETVFICIPLAVVIMTSGKAEAGQSVLPLLGLFAYAGFRAIPSFNRMAMHINNIRYGIVEADLLCDDMRLLEKAGPPPGGAGEPFRFERSLAAEGVCFAYDPETEPVLKDVSLVINHGESVAIVGATGAGKSTIIDIILGLLPPSSGRVTVDDVDISCGASAWRRKIGYVPQSIYLTNDTLRRNIAFGLPDREIVEEKVRDALCHAQLEDFVAGLPEGLATVIGERGITISGGEKQRVAIARALYRDPELLIFDEATSALDSRTEQALAQAIMSLHGRATIILVAHRMQTVKYCDRIIFLRNGHIEASGTWDELMQGCPEFRALVLDA